MKASFEGGTSFNKFFWGGFNYTDKTALEWIKWYILGNKEMEDFQEEVFVGNSFVTDVSRQNCDNMFISMSFRGKFMTWKDFSSDLPFYHSIGPLFYSTDFGACCLFIPHLNFENHYYKNYHGIKADAKVNFSHNHSSKPNKLLRYKVLV